MLASLFGAGSDTTASTMCSGVLPTRSLAVLKVFGLWVEGWGELAPQRAIPRKAVPVKDIVLRTIQRVNPFEATFGGELRMQAMQQRLGALHVSMQRSMHSTRRAPKSPVTVVDVRSRSRMQELIHALRRSVKVVEGDMGLQKGWGGGLGVEAKTAES